MNCALLASPGVRGLLRMAARWIDACVDEKVGESESVAAFSTVDYQPLSDAS